MLHPIFIYKAKKIEHNISWLTNTYRQTCPFKDTWYYYLSYKKALLSNNATAAIFPTNKITINVPNTMGPAWLVGYWRLIIHEISILYELKSSTNKNS